MTVEGVHITRDSLPEGEYKRYLKMHPTEAIKMAGTFHCLTSEGNIATCDDGWLAIDSRGYPYPVNSFEFERTYRPIVSESRDEVHRQEGTGVESSGKRSDRQ